MVWSDADSERQVYQDQSGRLFDVLYMAHHAIRSSRSGGDRLTFELYRVPRDGKSIEAAITMLKLIVGPGDQGEPVVTVLPLCGAPHNNKNAEFIFMQSLLVKGSDFAVFLDFLPPHNGSGLERCD